MWHTADVQQDKPALVPAEQQTCWAGEDAAFRLFPLGAHAARVPSWWSGPFLHEALG